jgi:hypothetical protein
MKGEERARPTSGVLAAVVAISAILASLVLTVLPWSF